MKLHFSVTVCGRLYSPVKPEKGWTNSGHKLNHSQTRMISGRDRERVEHETQTLLVSSRVTKTDTNGIVRPILQKVTFCTSQPPPSPIDLPTALSDEGVITMKPTEIRKAH